MRRLGFGFGALVIVVCAVDWGALAAAPKTEGKVRRSIKDVTTLRDFEHLRPSSSSSSGDPLEPLGEPPPEDAKPPPRDQQGCDKGSTPSDAGAGGAAIGGVAKILMYLLVAVTIALIIGVIVWAIMNAAKNRGKDKGDNDDPDEDDDPELLMPKTPPGDVPADVYLARAQELAKDGDYKGAIRQLLLGAMSWIERAGYISYRDGLTNRDYLRAIWRRAEQREKLARIVREFEEVYFGRRTADNHRFQRCLRSYEGGFDIPGPEPDLEPAQEPA